MSIQFYGANKRYTFVIYRKSKPGYIIIYRKSWVNRDEGCVDSSEITTCQTETQLDYCAHWIELSTHQLCHIVSTKFELGENLSWLKQCEKVGVLTILLNVHILCILGIQLDWWVQSLCMLSFVENFRTFWHTIYHITQRKHLNIFWNFCCLCSFLLFSDIHKS